jgi:hypothetical protein
MTDVVTSFGAAASSCYPLHVARCVSYYDGMGLTDDEKLCFGNASGFPQPTTAQEVADTGELGVIRAVVPQSDAGKLLDGMQPPEQLASV